MRYTIIIMTLILFNGCEKKENHKIIDYSVDNCIDNNESFQPVVIPDNDDYQLIFFRDSKIQIYTDNNGSIMQKTAIFHSSL